MENAPRSPGSEEYLDSEKYQRRVWDLDRADSLAPFIARVNAIRREHLALHANESLRFHATDNDQLIAYAKRSGDEAILCVVNLDPVNPQSGWVDVDTAALGLEPGAPFHVHDLLGGQHFTWQAGRNFVLLDPAHAPGHVFLVRARARSEHDFDYFV